MKYVKKPIVIEAIKFDEFVESVKYHCKGRIHEVFMYKGFQCRYENDRCYIVTTLEGLHSFTPDDMLITGIKGEIYPCKIDIFEATYDLYEG